MHRVKGCSIIYDLSTMKNTKHMLKCVKAVDEVSEVSANGNGHAAKSKASEPELAVHTAKPLHDEKSVLKSQTTRQECKATPANSARIADRLE